MGSQKQNKISMDVATDHSNSSSLDYSLSFTSLVCIDPPNHQSNKDQSPHDSNKSSPPDSGGGHLLPLEFLLKSRPPSLGGDGERKLNGEVRNQGKRETMGSKLSFGRKLLRSFVSPCRECRVVKPSTVKAPAKHHGPFEGGSEAIGDGKDANIFLAKSMVFITWAKTRFWSNGFAQISALFEACLAASHGFA
ncbi:hypothetical protein Gogos_013000, partial [Gossypium gossypioides]|nr:hypothetical protein [Gossypium gossypioides]